MFQPYASVATNLLFFDKVHHSAEKEYATREIWYYEHRMPEGYKAYSKTRPIQVAEFEPIKQWWNNRQESDVCWKVSIDTIADRNYDLDIKNPTRKEEAHEYSSSELIDMLTVSLQKTNLLLTELRNVAGITTIS